MFYMSILLLHLRNTGLNLRSISIDLYLIGFTEFRTMVSHPTEFQVICKKSVIYYEQGFPLEVPLSLYQRNSNGTAIKTMSAIPPFFYSNLSLGPSKCPSRFRITNPSAPPEVGNDLGALPQVGNHPCPSGSREPSRELS